MLDGGTGCHVKFSLSITVHVSLDGSWFLWQEAEARGEDYDRLKLLEVTAEDAEKLDKRKKRKKNADGGFSGMKRSIKGIL